MAEASLHGRHSVNRRATPRLEMFEGWTFSAELEQSTVQVFLAIAAGNARLRRYRCVLVRSCWRSVMKVFSLALAAATFIGSMSGASAQVYPSRPITVVVAFAAGGSGDTIMRIVADHMRNTLGQTIIIENVGGAAGSIGVGRVARATPDGYTLSYGNWPTHVLNGAVYTLNYDLLKDFEPISLVSIESIAIVGRKYLPAHDLKGLIDWLKANPGKA